MKLEGSLDTFPLRELIEMVVYSSVTGVLNIFGPGDIGHLYFRDSVLYHVECGQSHGLEALAELLDRARGEFSFVSDNVSDQSSLHGPLDTLLQTAEQIAARWRRIRAYVPSLDLIPQLLVAREAANRRAGPALQTVLALIDGRVSLRQIAAQLGWSEIDIAEAVAQLSVDGLVELRSTRQQPGQPHPHEPARSEGIFDRILSRSPPGDAQPCAVEAPQRSSSEELILRVLRGSS